MKKVGVLLAILCCLVLTGCGNDNSVLGDNHSGKKTCTNTTTDEDGYKTTDTMIITYKNDKVTNVEDTEISEVDPNYIDFTYQIGQLFADKLSELKGFEIKYSKEGSNQIKVQMNVDFTEMDINNIKETLGDLYFDEESFYSKNDITIDDFISTNLEGYTCK